MVDVCYDAKVSVSFDWYFGDALFEVALCAEGLGVGAEVGEGGGETFFKGTRDAIAAKRGRPPMLEQAARGPDAWSHEWA